MPQRNKRNNRSKKGKSKRTNVGQRVAGFNPVVPYIFPSLFKGCVTYSDTFAINNLGSNGVASYVYRANSIYDPNFTATGTTSTGYTQLAQLYDRYRVLSATLEADFAVTAGTVGGDVFVVASNNNSLGTGLVSWAAQRYVWRRPIGSINGNGTAKCRVSFPIHKVYGVPKTQVRNEDDFASVMGNNPNNVVYLHFGYQCNTTAGTATVVVSTRLVQNIVCSLPVTLAA